MRGIYSIRNRLVKFSEFNFAIREAMTWWLRCWILNPEVPGSKPPGGCKVGSSFHPSKVNCVLGAPGDLVVKRKLLTSKGSAVGLHP